MNTQCPECRAVLEMLKAHKRELMHVRANLDEAYETVDKAAMYVHTMALALLGQKPDMGEEP